MSTNTECSTQEHPKRVQAWCGYDSQQAYSGVRGKLHAGFGTANVA